MRPIKFRGRRIDNGQWVYGSLLQKYDPAKVENVVLSTFIHDGALSQNQVDPETVGQYTGKKDKNGKEAYSQDIYKTQQGFIGAIEWCDVDLGFKLRYNNGTKEVVDWLCMYPNGEVIDNIYSNENKNIRRGT